MYLFSKQEIRILVAELVVVVLGILIAFQVEEWRDNLRVERDIQASLERLSEETEGNLEICSRIVPESRELASLTLLLLDILSEGRLEEGDTERFENSLATINYVPTPPFASTVSEEMISTGLLKNVADDTLRRNIAGAASTLELLATRYGSVERSLLATADELNRTIEFRYDGSRVPSELGGQGKFEAAISVEYDIDRLLANTYLRNILVEAADSRADRYIAISDYCDAIERIDQSLQALNK